VVHVARLTFDGDGQIGSARKFFYIKAAPAFCEAAEAGDMTIQTYPGRAQQSGSGIRRDDAEAMQWCR
jgi:TPR repeat protein